MAVNYWGRLFPFSPVTSANACPLKGCRSESSRQPIGCVLGASLLCCGEVPCLPHQVQQSGEHSDVAWLETHLLNLLKETQGIAPI